MTRSAHAAVAVLVVAALLPRLAVAEPSDSTSDARLERIHTTLELITAGALALTAGLGTVAALNQATAFGDGRCFRGDPIAGEYGCGNISTLHGIAGVTTVVGFTATTTLGLALPPEPIRSSASHRVLESVAAVGIYTLPVLGIVSRFPGVVGVGPEHSLDVSRDLRTVHISLAVLTAATYLTLATWDVLRGGK